MNSATRSLTLFHEIISVLLEEMKMMQENPPLLSIKLFGQLVNVRLILEVAFVMGDQLSQDQHCGRIMANAGGASRVHRSCMTSFIAAQKVDKWSEDYAECQPMPKGCLETLCQVMQHGAKAANRTKIVEATFPINDALPANHATTREANRLRKSFDRWLRVRSTIAKEIHQKTFGVYPINNAWSQISFGDNPNGIYRATLDDPLHYSSSGVFTYLANVSFYGFLPSEAKMVESFLREDFSKRCSVKYDFPLTRYPKGFSNCTLQTASEKVGLVFSLYLGLGTKRIADVFNKSIARQQKKYLDLTLFNPIKNKKDSKDTLIDVPPKADEKYFFKKWESDGSTIVRMDRKPKSIREIVEHMDSFRLLFVLRSAPMMDELQIEYLT